MRVGFIGLGSQGGPMARKIVESGYETTLWARRPASVEPYSDTSAAIASTPAELAAQSDLVCLCVVGDADVQEIVLGDNGILAGLKDGGIIAIHSTVHPDTVRDLADKAAPQGVSVIDAPVSGGGGAAAEGKLLVMVGGDSEVVERARPVFETYADPVVHLGELGSGQVTKLLNNLLFTAHLATAASTLALGRALGIEPERLGQVITKGTSNSYALTSVVASGGTTDRIKQHAGGLLQKDVRLIADLADKASVDGGIVLQTADAALVEMDHPR